MLDKYPKYSTKVTNNNILAQNIKYLILKTTSIDKKGIIINKRVLIN